MIGRLNVSRADERFVYFIQSGSERGPVKIGFSKNPTRRLFDLQKSSPDKLTLLGVIFGDFKKEKELHRKFAPFALGNEWFLPSHSLREFLTKLIEEHGVDVPDRRPHQYNSSSATLAQQIVFDAARPVSPGETVRKQKDRAFNRLDLGGLPHGRSRLIAAWKGRAGPPTLQALQEQARKVGLYSDTTFTMEAPQRLDIGGMCPPASECAA